MREFLEILRRDVQAFVDGTEHHPYVTN